MGLSVWEASSLEAIGERAWTTLFMRSPSATVFQSWDWLHAWWEVFGTGRASVPTVWEDGELVGAAALYTDSASTLRFVAGNHADYGGVLVVDDRRDVVDALVRIIFKTRTRWKMLELVSVLEGSPLSTSLRAAGARSEESVVCPRVVFSVRSLSSLLSKQSLKRHAKALVREGAVQVLHLDEESKIKPWLEAFFRQHRERWVLTATPSLFSNPKNVAFYKKLIAAARPGGISLFTVVLCDERPVAMHLGFRSQKDFIWYKPTFDPRFSRLGPGEVLLAEILKKASEEGAEALDFARGDESFKKRFASEVRTVSTYTARATTLGRVVYSGHAEARERMLRMLERLGVRGLARTFARGIGATVRMAKNDGVASASNEVRRHLTHHYRSICLYSRNRTDNGDELRCAETTVERVETLSLLLEVFDIDNTGHREVLASAMKRLDSGARLWVLKHGGYAVSCGWESECTRIFMAEFDIELESDTPISILFDFRTFGEHQRRGYYRTLLQAIKVPTTVSHQLIYARSDNDPSIRGIEGAHFQRLGRVHRRIFSGIRLDQVSGTLGEPALRILEKERGTS